MNNSDIVGKWKSFVSATSSIDGHIYFEFKSDNTYVTNAISGEILEGKYELNGQKLDLINMEHGSVVMTVTAKIADGTLTIIFPNQDRTSFILSDHESGIKTTNSESRTLVTKPQEEPNPSRRVVIALNTILGFALIALLLFVILNSPFF